MIFTELGYAKAWGNTRSSIPLESSSDARGAEYRLRLTRVQDAYALVTEITAQLAAVRLGRPPWYG